MSSASTAEIAVIVTGPQLECRESKGPVLVIHQSDALLDKMDAWNKGTHGKSGLIDKVKASTLTEAEEERAGSTSGFSGAVCAQGLPMCGNTISQDRRFPGQVHAQAGGLLSLPQHGRQYAQGAGQALAPRGVQRLQKAAAHTALADVHESIDELVHYRSTFFE
jgi:oligoribonuclease